MYSHVNDRVFIVSTSTMTTISLNSTYKYENVGYTKTITKMILGQHTSFRYCIVYPMSDYRFLIKINSFFNNHITFVNSISKDAFSIYSFCKLTVAEFT